MRRVFLDSIKSGMEEENVHMFDEPRRKQILNVVDMLDVLGLFKELKLAHFTCMRRTSSISSL